jgi:hypothetical protein
MLGKDKPFELLLMRHYSIDSYSKYVFVRVETFIITIIMQQQIVVTDRFNQSIYQFDFLLTTSINEMFELLYQPQISSAATSQILSNLPYITQQITSI